MMKNLMGNVVVCFLALSAGVFVAPKVRAQDAAEKTYKTKCAACHSADGSGSEVGKKLGAHNFHAEEVQKMSDAEFAAVIAKGKNKMPAYEKTLKPDEVKGLATYVRSLSKK
jgi:mono/diheme cytochrome c family protein